MPRLSKIGAAALAAFGWTSGSAVTASYLVVAGGGSGGGTANTIAGGGGGGAGGLLTGTTSLNPTLSYTITVGAGGAGVTNANGNSGSNSLLGSIATATGGGFGSRETNSGGSGGSGGGRSGTTGSAGTGTVGQGNNGGNGTGDGGGGGGGAGAVGGNSGTSGGSGGAGGAGSASSITGSSVTYAGGGGGGLYNSGSGGAGGSGGGGAGSVGAVNGNPGTANLGGGGGGAGSASSGGPNTSGNGGSGVVIISYVGAQQFGGGVVTSSGGNTIHTFTTSGTLSPLNSLTANFLVVAGGGGGGGAYGGGGGAGGLRSSVTNTGGGGSLESSLTIDTNSIYLVTVGAGGVGAQYTVSQANSGSNSAFLSITSTGGGRSGLINTAGASGGSGGGGGSASGTGAAGGSGTANQGFAGGTGAGYDGVNGYAGGGGGGAGAVGQSRTAGQNTGGNGGAGVTVAITGSSVGYAGGGGGSGYTTSGGTATDGGGAGANYNVIGSSGSANRGGGGGGGGAFPDFSGSGGSGVVIISYPGTTQQMAGGTVTVAGGNVIHTFTSSGYLTPIVLVTNSLRFRSSAGAYLNRTPSVASNRRTYTWSGWVKLGSLDVARQIFGTSGGSTQDALVLNAQNQLVVFTENASQTLLRTAQLFRDPSAWYHIVWAEDTTQATASNRSKLYINGVQVTTLDYAQYPSLNYQGSINNNVIHYISSYDGGTSWLFNGYLADVNFIDGLALTPNSFGTFNGLGVWQPIRYGGSYGTNGFYLPFTANPSATGSTFAALFNGSNYISSNYSYNWSTGGSFTMEAWINPSSLSTLNMIGGTSHSINDGYSMFYYYANGRLAWGINGVNEFTSATGVIVTNKWQHVACVNNGGTLTLYVNGVAVASNASGGTYLSNNSATMYIGSTASANQGVNGYMSNWRFVTSAVYTGSFTPSSTPLTSITNTQLLTFQNSAIQDNSGNSITLTNNGSVTTGVQYPFVTQAFNDQSPNGNNWTPNNISGLFGSSYDFMTDVPTLTSATTANYAVLNPLFMPIEGSHIPFVLSNGNLTYFGNTGSLDSSTPSTIGFTTGQFYAEFTIANTGGGGTDGLGIAYNLPNRARTFGVMYRPDGSKVIDGSASSYGSSYTTGDIIGVAVNASSNSITFYKNNVSQGAISFTPTSTIFYAIYASNQPSPFSGSVNFGQRPFSYTPPTGFVALNTFNLPTPTIGATASTTANKYMDATTYSGNGGTQSITSLGFQPDLVWVKRRDTAASHNLVDAVRGASKILYSDATTAEITDSNDINAFNSNGWTMGLNTDVNASGGTYVGWTWRASNATAVTNTQGSITSTVSVNTTAGFSIVTYTGNGTNGATVGHGLGVAPSLMFVKDRSQGGTYRDWAVYSPIIGAGNSMYLNSTSGSFSKPSYWNSTTATSTVFTLGNDITVNQSGDNFVAYCFAPVAGYSAFGSYTGNGSSDGTFVYTGFRPRFILYKNASYAGTGWAMLDSSRDTFNVLNDRLFAESSAAEDTSVSPMDFTSNGFKVRSTNDGVNKSGDTIIYMAFAESPFKYANAR